MELLFAVAACPFVRIIDRLLELHLLGRMFPGKRDKRYWAEPPLVNRTDFQELAEMRLREADILFAAGQYPGAYYLAGYALECGLKACIAKLTQQFDYPDKKKANDAYSHSLDKLIKIANLEIAHQLALANAQFQLFWLVAKDWDEESRYKKTLAKNDAEDLLKAIKDPAQGILQWIKSNW